MKAFKMTLKLLIFISIVCLFISSVHAEDTNSTDIFLEQQADIDNDTFTHQLPKSYSMLSDKVNDAQTGLTLNLIENYRYNSTIDESLKEGVEYPKTSLSSQ